MSLFREGFTWKNFKGVWSSSSSSSSHVLEVHISNVNSLKKVDFTLCSKTDVLSMIILEVRMLTSKPEGDRVTATKEVVGHESIKGEGGCSRACNRVQTLGIYSLQRELSRDPRIFARGTKLETYARVLGALVLEIVSRIGRI